ASYPAWSADGSRLAFDVQDDLFLIDYTVPTIVLPCRINAPLPGCPVQLTTTAAIERAPSWSQRPGDTTSTQGRLVYTLGTDSACSGGDLLVLSVTKTVSTVQTTYDTSSALLLKDGRFPSWADAKISFVRGSSIWTAHTSTSPPSAYTQWTTDNRDTRPALALTPEATFIAFDRIVDAQHDVMLVDSRRRAVVVTAYDADDYPADLRADVTLGCGGNN